MLKGLAAAREWINTAEREIQAVVRNSGQRESPETHNGLDLAVALLHLALDALTSAEQSAGAEVQEEKSSRLSERFTIHGRESMHVEVDRPPQR